MFALLLCLPQALAADLDPWFLAGSRPENYTMELDEAVFHDGSSSARLASEKTRGVGFGTMMQNFSPEEYAGKRLQLSAWVRSEDVKGWAGVWMRIDGTQAGGSLAFDNMSDRPISGDTEWTRHTVVLDVPAEATNIAFGVLLNGGGSVWIDALEFEVVPDSVPSTNRLRTQPANLGFED